MKKTELRERLTVMQGMMDVLDSLESQMEFYTHTDEETGEVKEPEFGDYSYQMYMGLKEVTNLIRKEIEKRI